MCAAEGRNKAKLSKLNGQQWDEREWKSTHLLACPFLENLHCRFHHGPPGLHASPYRSRQLICIHPITALVRPCHFSSTLLAQCWQAGRQCKNWVYYTQQEIHMPLPTFIPPVYVQVFVSWILICCGPQLSSKAREMVRREVLGRELWLRNSDSESKSNTMCIQRCLAEFERT